MELIIINQSKLKIMLTPPDMQRYELSAEQMDCADEQTRRAFRHIFDDARDRIGFDTTGEKLLVQLYTSREGGCEIFVTKLGDREGIFPHNKPQTTRDTHHTKALTTPEETLLRRVLQSEETDMSSLTNAGRPLPTLSHSPSLPTEAQLRSIAIAFPHMSALLAACHRLQHAGYLGESDAYIDDSERVPAPTYLFLNVPDNANYRLPERFAFLNEYGRAVESVPLRLYVTEHGRVLCGGDAVGTLGCL